MECCSFKVWAWCSAQPRHACVHAAAIHESDSRAVPCLEAQHLQSFKVMKALAMLHAAPCPCLLHQAVPWCMQDDLTLALL